jgi:hypothetical protein
MIGKPMYWSLGNGFTEPCRHGRRVGLTVSERIASLVQSRAHVFNIAIQGGSPCHGSGTAGRKHPVAVQATYPGIGAGMARFQPQMKG